MARIHGYLAPAGTPLVLRDLRGVPRALRSAADAMVPIEAALRAYSGRGKLFYYNTGRAALVALLKALRRTRATDPRDEILVPGYTCYSVPASIIRAGYRVRVCDVDPDTLDYDREALTRVDPRRLVAVMSANLYGLPNSLEQLEAYARSEGILLIDDAAQALGARLGSSAVGSFGAAGLFSFDKGKVVTSMQGGVLAVRDSVLSDALVALQPQVPAANRVATFVDLAKYLVYMALLPPNRYWVTRYMPFLGLGKTRFDTSFRITRLSPLLAALVVPQMAREPDLRAKRTANAERLRSAVRPLRNFRLIDPVERCQPAWIRLPVLARTAELRDRAIDQLNRAGIGASRSYPDALCDVPELRTHLVAPSPTPGAREIAARLFTLPTHPYVSLQHLARIAAGLERTDAEAG